MNIPREIFKMYDIRGLVGSQVNSELSFALGKAFVTLIASENPGKDLTIAVGRDMRASSPEFQQALMKGMTEAGADVKDIGLVSTPSFYFGVGDLECDGGMMVTASHNPEQDNGFKMTRAKARPVSGIDGIKELADIIEADEYIETDKVGSIEIVDGIPQKFVKESIRFAGEGEVQPLKIVVDPGNGMGAQYLQDMEDQVDSIDFVKMYWELDGSFPNHESNPFKDENNVDIQKRIVEEGADLGIATDGDGDRIFFFDETGAIVDPAIIRGLISQIVLRTNPGARIGYDIRPGKITEDMILESGGKPFITKVGHSLIKTDMIANDSPFSGESSGHFFYKYPTGSYEGPVTVVVHLLHEMSKKGVSLKELVGPLRKYVHSSEINFDVEDKLATIERIKQHFSDGELNELDGISIKYDDVWFNIRASNTESKLRLNLEAIDQATMEKRRDEVIAVIKS
ncbi:phosphomannomutase/phosphoglucomutase [Candidatus Uhrbacteria bacterium]|jgi:phosphomannomutase|nr:phosphomannomutase/phosphoglucomutase [Candidatus Uhrbacteria bacterium]MBT7717512.1 phosphomannomutase/phosphoglucomutase [Candidatus Uhrbacteria bacterium]